jgi:hypothetical protein
MILRKIREFELQRTLKSKFWYLKHNAAKSLFETILEKVGGGFENWTFLKCPKIKNRLDFFPNEIF